MSVDVGGFVPQKLAYKPGVGGGKVEWAEDLKAIKVARSSRSSENAQNEESRERTKARRQCHNPFPVSLPVMDCG